MDKNAIGGVEQEKPEKPAKIPVCWQCQLMFETFPFVLFGGLFGLYSIGAPKTAPRKKWISGLISAGLFFTPMYIWKPSKYRHDPCPWDERHY